MDTFALFQFHKGAIGVVDAAAESIVNRRFQFHKGAIGVSTVPKYPSSA